MFNTHTDYCLYPTLSVLSKNDREKMYKKTVSFDDIQQKFQDLEDSYNHDRESFQNRIMNLEDTITKLKEHINRLENMISRLDTNQFMTGSDRNRRKIVLNLEEGELYTMGTYAGEAIPWRVLKVTDDKILLLSENGLDRKPYHETEKKTTWENSDIRRWLNQTFIHQAFRPEEKQKVLVTSVNNSNDLENSTAGMNVTQDQLFLLSIKEVKEFFPSDESRICYLMTNSGPQSSINSCSWWLRSFGNNIRAAFVRRRGDVFERGQYIYSDNVAVRPAMWINRIS